MIHFYENRGGFLTAALATISLSIPVLAQQGTQVSDVYPKKQAVRIVVGIAPGGGTDIAAREVAKNLTSRMGGSFIVENRDGASGAIAMQFVAKSAPDGYTLYVAANSAMAIAPMLKTVSFDTRKAFASIVHMDTQPYLLTVTPSLPVSTLRELIAYAKARPGSLNFGSSGYTSPSYTGMVDFKSLTGTDIVHVPYKGAAVAALDAIGGRIQILLGSAVTVGTFVKNGKLKPIVVTSLRRTQAYPDLPTAAEAGLPGFEASITHSLFTVGGTPRPVILAINKEVNQIMRLPDINAKLAADGAEAEPPNSPEALDEKIAKEFIKWEKFYKENPDALQLGR